MVIVLQWQVKEGCLPLPHPFPHQTKKGKNQDSLSYGLELTHQMG